MSARLSPLSDQVPDHGLERAGPGEGSAFPVRLPRIEPAPPIPVVPARRRVLVIEDNEDIRESLRELLEDLGHEVQVAVDGRSGLRLLLEMKPDVALVDVGLPGLDGYAVALQARAAIEGRGVYLVALTGHSGLEARRQSEAAGFDRHVSKPLKAEELSSLVESKAAGR